MFCTEKLRSLYMPVDLNPQYMVIEAFKEKAFIAHDGSMKNMHSQTIPA